MLKRVPFIAPMIPTLTKVVPLGDEWLHEIKFDGFRVQVHVEGESVTIYSRNGHDLTRRFRRLKDILAAVPAKSAIIDAELVACDESGQPDFNALMSRRKDCELCVWAFDLLLLNGVAIADRPLVVRRAMLSELVNAADEQGLQMSLAFDNPVKLFALAEKMQLEGIVSKRKKSRYRSGPTKEWLKIKTNAWRQAHKDRGELFKKNVAA